VFVCVCVQAIQGVPGGKVSILGDHSVGYSKEKLYICVCAIPNGFRDMLISLYSSKIVDKKEILRAVSNTGIYCSSDKVGTVYLV
jgi:predicted transport protein